MPPSEETPLLGIDGFPFSAEEQVRYHQTEIDHFLAVVAQRERSLTVTFPAAFSLERDITAQVRWMGPFVQRLDWLVRNRELLPASGKWIHALSHCLEIVFNRAIFDPKSVPGADDLEFLALVIGLSSTFEAEGCSEARSYLRLVLPVLLRDGRDTSGLLDNLAGALGHWSFLGERDAWRTAEMGWMLFLSPRWQGDGSPCWSARVRRDWMAMPPSSNRRWGTLFRAASKLDKAAKAVQAIPREELHSNLDLWFTSLAAQPEPHLSYGGLALLRHLLALVAAERLTGPARQFASSSWAAGLSRELAKLLVTEFLNGLAEWNSADRRDIAGLLAQSNWAAGNPLLRRIPDEPETVEQRLDSWLAESRSALDPVFPLETIVGGKSPQALRDFVRALLPKIDEMGAGCGSPLRRALFEAFRREPAFTVEDLIGLAQRRVELAWPHIQRYTQTRGYEPRLAQAVREWHPHLHGSIAEQTLRKHVGWWLWLDETVPVDKLPKEERECWSIVVRQDLRSVQPESKGPWLRLLGNITFAVGNRIPKKWEKEARVCLKEVGAESFRRQMVKWFAPFREGRPVRLSVPGRDLLRCLLWYATLADDSSIDEAVASLAQANWKSKKDVGRLPVVLGPFLDLLERRRPELAHHAIEELIRRDIVFKGGKDWEAYVRLCAQLGCTPIGARELPPVPQPPKPDDPAYPLYFLRSLVRTLPFRGQIEIGEQEIVVHGRLSTYRIDIRSETARDQLGRRVTVDLTVIPGGSPLQSMIDRHDLEAGGMGINPGRLWQMIFSLSHDDQLEHCLRFG